MQADRACGAAHWLHLALCCRFNGARAMKSPSKLSGAVEEAEAVEAPLPPQERREIERAVESDPKKIASIFDDSASSKVEQRDSSTGELKPDDGLLDDPHQAREQLAIERMEQSIDEDYNREEAREKARKQFLQQACKHFRAAQRSCLLKNVEMRGRCVRLVLLHPLVIVDAVFDAIMHSSEP